MIKDMRRKHGKVCGLTLLAGALSSGCVGSTDTNETGAEKAESVGVSVSAVTGLHPLGSNRDSAQLVASKKTTMAPLASGLPSAVDLSASLPAPGDQGRQGSCVGWAVAYATKTYQEVVEQGWSRDQARYQYSPSFIYNQINGGSDNGAYMGTALDLVVSKGADSLKFFPYSDSNFTTQPDAASLTRAANFKALSWSTLAQSTSAIKLALASGSPVLVTFDVMSDFDNLSAQNPTYDTAAPATNRGNHAAVLTGYDDQRGAFRLLNSWGTGWGLSGTGWLAYSFVTNSDLRLIPYVLNDGRNAAPSVTNSLYAINGGGLYLTDNDFGTWSGFAQSWTGPASMTALSGKVYAIAEGQLRKFDPATGTYTVLGNEPWVGPTEMTANGSSLYITEVGGLWRVNPSTGAYARVGSGDWTGTTSIASVGSSLYIIAGDRLHKVNPSTGADTILGPNTWWGGETTMAVIGSTLYVTQDGGLWQVNTSTGDYAQVTTGNWADASAMAALNSKLYITAFGSLHEVDPATQQFEIIGAAGEWGGSTVMAAVK